jgi:hypothetical protein
MKLLGYKILKEVAKKRVITLGEARKLFATNFNDERDFFALASLYTERYVDSSWVREGCNWDTNKISLVARELYLMSLGPGKHTMVGVYEDIPDIPGDIINDADYNVEFKIYCTGKTDLFLHEQRSKSIERIVALLIGIFIAVFSAAATAYLTKLIAH